MKSLFISLIISLLIISCSSCEGRKKIIQATSIDTYYIPFGILSPIGGLTSEGIITSPNVITLTDKTSIREITTKINELEKIKNTKVFDDDNIYLRVDFNFDNGKKMTLLYDKASFKINNCYYKKDIKLINLLIGNAG